MKSSQKRRNVRRCRATSPGSPIDYVCGEASRGGIVRKRDTYRRQYYTLRRAITGLREQYRKAEGYERRHMLGLDVHEQVKVKLERGRTNLERQLQQKQERLKALHNATLKTPEAITVRTQSMAPLQTQANALAMHIARYRKAESEVAKQHQILLTQTRQQNESIEQLTARLHKMEMQQTRLLKMLQAVNADYTQLESALA